MQQTVFPHYFDVAFDIVTLGASLGGLEALIRILSGLPADFPCPLVLVQHIPADSPSHLPHLLSRHTRLSVARAEEGERLRAGTLYIAPPNRHLLVTAEKTLRLSDGPKIAFARPAVSPLFETAAACFGERALAVVLTGAGRDGMAGVQAIKDRGGRVIAQDRQTSKAFSMPAAAIATGCVDFVLPIEKIAPALMALVTVRGAASLFQVAPPLALSA